MTQQRLPGVRTAPVGIAISAQWNWHSGWNARVSWRASGDQHWTTRDYCGLIGQELVDVLAAELEQLAGASRPAVSGGADGAG